jgi:transaldolase
MPGETSVTRLHRLYQDLGQSPWVDNLQRSWLSGGRLAELVSQGVRGVTSNPTIFAKAIESSDDYDDQFRSLYPALGVEGAYWDMVGDDVAAALEVLRPVYDESGGADGFVSLEISPELAHDTDSSLAAARDLHRRFSQPNLMIKVPATREGLPAIEQLYAEGISVNVTLIFGLTRYREVVAAYQRGLSRLAESRGPGSDLSDVAGVASFFVSRVDTLVDSRLEEMAAQTADGGAALLARRGTAAIAQVKLAYQAFEELFASAEFAQLAARGARRQRPLWASTSTKNPHYPDLDYVDNLIGPDTVNTMPEAVISAYLDHGRLERTIDRDLDQATRCLEELTELGVDFDSVADELEAAGVQSFKESFEELMTRLADKVAQLGMSA